MSKIYVASYTQQLMNNLARDGFRSAEYKFDEAYEDTLWDWVAESGAMLNSRLLYYIVMKYKELEKDAALKILLPVGIEMTVPNSVYGDIDCVLIGKGIDGTNGLTWMTKDIVCERCFDAIEPTYTGSDRTTGGSNRYATSNILQWLNSAKPAGGQWYAAQHTYDAPPDSSGTSNNAYDEDAGFLAGFDRHFLDALKPVSKVTCIPSRDSADVSGLDDGSHLETVTEFATSGGTGAQKMFLLSATEVNLTDPNDKVEGSAYPYFTNNASRQAFLSDHALKNTDYIDLADDIHQKNNPYSWWLRTPERTSSVRVYFVNKNSGLEYTSAKNGVIGVRPAFVL